MAQKTWNSRAQLAKSHNIDFFCLVMSFDSIDYVIFACVGVDEDVRSAGRAVSPKGGVASFLFLRLLEVDAVAGEGCCAERTFPLSSGLS